MTPSHKEALEDLQHFSETQLDRNPKMQKVVATVVAALATLPPDPTTSKKEVVENERREAIARAKAWADRIRWLLQDEPGSLAFAVELHKNAKAILRSLDDLLASGLVQDEAVWRDISTAPKNGEFLVVENGRVVMVDAVRAMGTPKLRRCGGASHNYFVNDATHWMPLPAPPIRSARDGGAES